MPTRRSAMIVLGAATLGACAAPGDSATERAAPPWPAGRWLLLGELHDHPEHHRLRAEGIDRLLTDGIPTAVAFEMIGRRHTAAAGAAGAAVAAAGAGAESAAERVADAAEWDRAGWGWPLHRPVLAAALRGGARIVGANLEPAEAREIASRGAEALPADIAAALARDTDWGVPEQAALEAEIDAGHCGLLPRARWAPMVLAQRARDAAMALALQQAMREGARRVVLIAGNGHVRRDLGVPRVLAAQGVAPRSIVAVAYLEVGQPSPGSTQYDQVVRTAALPARPDPCEGLRRRV